LDRSVTDTTALTGIEPLKYHNALRAEKPKDFQYKDLAIESLTFGEISNHQGFVCCEIYTISQIKVTAGSQTVIRESNGKNLKHFRKRSKEEVRWKYLLSPGVRWGDFEVITKRRITQ
jgi:hypothetical protein